MNTDRKSRAGRSAMDIAAARRERTSTALQAVMTEPTVDLIVAGLALGVGRTAAYTAAVSGEIPTIKVGGKIRVSTAALREMLGLKAPAISVEPEHMVAA